MENEITSRKNTARLAGLLYLIWTLIGLYSMFYVSSKIMVKGDIVATANNLLANEFIFRTGIVTDLIDSAVWVFMALVFYRLFKQVDEYQAKVLVALVIVQIPVTFIGGAINITSLMIAKGQILETFELSQRQDLAMAFLKINDYITLTLEMYWGLWLFPLGILVYRSHFLPRFLGVWLIICGLAYLVLSLTAVLLPHYNNVVFYFAIPAFLGELAFMLWLLIMGVKKNIPAISI